MTSPPLTRDPRVQADITELPRQFILPTFTLNNARSILHSILFC